MAKLPEAFLHKPGPQLHQIAVGTTAFVQPTALRVNSELDCFLQPTAPYETEKSIMHILRVKRSDDGFHVAILAPWRIGWTPGAVSENAIPVASIVEDYDPRVDIEAKYKKT